MINKLDTTKVIAIGFLLIILFGSLLLSLPIASANKEWTNWPDALFTATTSVCVTGLVTVPIHAHYSLFGKIVILILIQFGGFGLVTVTMIFFQFITKSLTLQDRKMISEAYGLTHMNGMGAFIVRVVKGTFIVEGIGAILFSFQFIPEFGPLKGIWYSVFHAVSAFCNAGLDLIGSSSFQPYIINPIINFTTIFLIFMGNIGFIVWWDIKEMLQNRRHPLELEIHTKLVLLTSVVVYILPVCVFLITEFNNPNTIGNLSTPQKIMACMFQGATLRTAGFETISQSNFGGAVSMLSIILMFIGGSPTGTAGGVKTTTIAILVATVVCNMKNKKDTEIFKRRIAKDVITTAITIVFINILLIFFGTCLICAIEKVEMTRALFEITSAVTTTGLSMGVCGNLYIISKFIIIICMYIGRIGAVTLVLALNTKKGPTTRYELAEGKVLVG